MSRTRLARTSRRMAGLFSHLGLDDSGFPRRQVRELVILASASRSGSSFLAEMLRRSSGLLHPRAEINPFLRLCGLGFPDNGTGSDALDATHLEKACGLEPFLLWDIGSQSPRLSPETRKRFALDLYGRLILQWPDLDLDSREVEGWLAASLESLEREHGWEPGSFPDVQLFHARFLAEARSAHHQINPYYYDLDTRLIRRFCSGAELPAGPPGETMVEEPPFITIAPVAPPGDPELPLLIKTPSNAYRLDFLRALFPCARIRILHLARNPAASINGLYDGWHHRGFFSHRLPESLDIQGYTDVLPSWARHWWNFDLPPGWKGWTEGPLVELCGYQWRRAHEAILERAGDSGVDYFRLQFEQLISRRQSRERAMHELVEWLGIGLDGLEEVITAGLPPIMATEPPRRRRWRRRRQLIEPVIDQPAVRETTWRLGYDENRSDWI